MRLLQLQFQARRVYCLKHLRTESSFSPFFVSKEKINIWASFEHFHVHGWTWKTHDDFELIYCQDVWVSEEHIVMTCLWTLRGKISASGIQVILIVVGEEIWGPVWNYVLLINPYFTIVLNKDENYLSIYLSYCMIYIFFFLWTVYIFFVYSYVCLSNEQY